VKGAFAVAVADRTKVTNASHAVNPMLIIPSFSCNRFNAED